MACPNQSISKCPILFAFTGKVEKNTFQTGVDYEF